MKIKYVVKTIGAFDHLTKHHWFDTLIEAENHIKESGKGMYQIEIIYVCD